MDKDKVELDLDCEPAADGADIEKLKNIKVPAGIFESVLFEVQEEEERRNPKVKQQRLLTEKFSHNARLYKLHQLAEKCATGELVSVLEPQNFIPPSPQDRASSAQIYQLALDFQACVDPSALDRDEIEQMHYYDNREMYQKLADGEWNPAFGASNTRSTLQLKLDLSPFLTKPQARERLNEFSVQTLKLLETVQQRFIFGQRLVCAAGWLGDLRHKDGKQVDIKRYGRLLTVAEASKRAGSSATHESIALELGWGTNYPDRKLAELSRDISDANELVRRAEMGTFPFNEWGELTLPSALGKTRQRTKITGKNSK